MTDNLHVIEPKGEVSIDVEATVQFKIALPDNIKTMRVDRAAGDHAVVGWITAFGHNEEEAREALAAFKAALVEALS